MHYIWAGGLGEVIFQKTVQFLFIIYMDSVFERLLVGRGEQFRPVRENLRRFSGTHFPQGDVPVLDSQQKSQKQNC